MPAEGDKVSVSYMDTGEKNPVVFSLCITEVAPWKPSGIPILDYADVGSRSQAVDQLAAIAEDEAWDHSHEPSGGKPILDSYLRYTFVRIQEEEGFRFNQWSLLSLQYWPRNPYAGGDLCSI